VDYAAGRAEQLRNWLAELVDVGWPCLRMLMLERQANREIGSLPVMLHSLAVREPQAPPAAEPAIHATRHLEPTQRNLAT
jgi:hypothetical protein